MINEISNIEGLKVGGQKEVFLATHPTYKKVVFKKIKNGSDSYERTKREVRAVSLLKSQFIPKIIAHNCDIENPPFIWLIEEYKTGSNLRDILSGGRKFTIREIVDFLDVMLSIAVESENNNLVHRDIKPDNIIFDDNGKFWLLDFGIARHLDLDSITDTNRNFGVFTIGYASSEQFRNQKSDIDIRADLFSIGVVCYELIKGENFYTIGVENDIFRTLAKLSNSSLPPLKIKGDNEFKLSTFIKILGDHRRTRRPRTAKEALRIFESLKNTLTLE